MSNLRYWIATIWVGLLVGAVVVGGIRSLFIEFGWWGLVAVAACVFTFWAFIEVMAGSDMAG